ncbi:MAG: hypothetical protein IT562_08960 [Alphaproteobacteria bacterium]|nr:hypothetical protein [Alphaproteobacteria bacterium]
MDQLSIARAARLLAEARRTRRRLDGLPASCRPATVDDALAIQAATVALLEDPVGAWPVGAWKVGAPVAGRLVRGAILRSRIFGSPAAVRAADMPLLGVEAEIAFRFDHGLPGRARDYTYEEVAAAATALAAIEIVDSRYADYAGAPMLDKIADCVSNGGLVCGTVRADWRDIDLASLTASLAIDGATVARQSGGHATRDPLLPAVAFANDRRNEGGLPAGVIVTTGTFTGLTFAKAGQSVLATFEGFGSAAVTFDA